MKENLQHSEAFEYYYSLGKERSLVAVSCQYDVSERTVARWSKTFSWQERIELRDIEISKKLEEKTNTTIVNEKANYRKIIKASIATFVERLKNKEVDVTTIADLERLIKLDLLLMGEATEQSKIEWLLPECANLSGEELIKYAEQIIERARPFISDIDTN